MGDALNKEKIPMNKARRKVRHVHVYVLNCLLGNNENVFSTLDGILVEESDCESVGVEVSDNEIDPLVAELEKIHLLKSHALDDNID